MKKVEWKKSDAMQAAESRTEAGVSDAGTHILIPYAGALKEGDLGRVASFLIQMPYTTKRTTSSLKRSSELMALTDFLSYKGTNARSRVGRN